MNAPSLKQACDGVKNFFQSQINYMAYVHQELSKKDQKAILRDSFEDGVQKVTKDTLLQTVLNMLQKNVALDFIKRISGSTDDEIKEVAVKHKLKINLGH